MTSNVASFNLDVSRYSREEVPRIVRTVHQRIAMQALRSLVLITPVDEGTAKGNWQTTLGAPAEGILETTDPSGTVTISKGQAVIAQVTPFGEIWLSNNLPYIERLEAGHSRQAPNGMLAVTLAELQTMFRSVEA